MDAPTYPARATPKSQRTRARILDAAMRLFAEMGYHAATNAVIAPPVCSQISGPVVR